MMSRNSENHTANAVRIRNFGVVEVSAAQQQQLKKKRKRKKLSSPDNGNGNIVIAGGNGVVVDIRHDNHTTHSSSVYSDRARCACETCNRSEQTNCHRNDSNGCVDIERHVLDVPRASSTNGDHPIVCDPFDGEVDFLRSSQAVINCGPSIGRRDGAHRFAIYENLCEFCGFAIGTGSYHPNCAIARCVRSKDDVTNNNSPSSENIYENICKSCHLIYSGDKCAQCECEIEGVTVRSVPSVPSPSSSAASVTANVCSTQSFGDDSTATTKPKRNQFSDLFGSLRQKFKERRAPVPPVAHRKIEIVHNFDRHVFKTNQTFDLNEIVELKLQQQRDKHIYGKLRKESCAPGASQHQSKHAQRPSFRTSASESNFFDCRFGRDQQLVSFHSSPYSDSIVSDTCLYDSNAYAAPPSYEDAIQNSLYTSVCINSSSTTIASHTSSTLSLFAHEREAQSIAAAAVGKLLVNNASLKHWMTSLRRETYDYDNVTSDRSFDCATVKCVPSKYSHCDANAQRQLTTDSDAFSAKLRDQIEAFKVNVMRTKQTAIQQCAQCLNEANVVVEATAEYSEIELETTKSAVECVESVARSACAVSNANASGFGELSTIHNYLQSVKTFYISQITVSTSLNRIVLVCGDKKFHYLIKLLCDNGDNRVSLPVRPITSYTKYTNINSLLIALQAMSASRQLSPSADGDDRVDAVAIGHRTAKSKFNDFLMATASESATKRFEDFDMSGRDGGAGPKKTLSDFVVRNPHSSSATANGDRHAPSNESIYQPIWMFKTVGHASRESVNGPDDECGCRDDDNAIGECADEATIDDGSEWEEVTEEEFLFSNDRFNSTTVNHHATSIGESNENTHMIDTEQYYPYQSVCILYSVDDAKYNKIIYDYNGNSSILTNANDCDGTDSIGACSLSGSNIELATENESRQREWHDSTNKAAASSVRFDSVDAWKAMLSSAHCLEDEEDLVSVQCSLLPHTIFCSFTPEIGRASIDFPFIKLTRCHSVSFRFFAVSIGNVPSEQAAIP